MKRKALSIIGALASAVLLSSCQKEFTIDDPTTAAGAGNGTQLRRMASLETGQTDSTIVLYTYTASNKILSAEASYKKSGQPAIEKWVLSRDANERITGFTYIATNTTTASNDTLIGTLHYTSATAATPAYLTENKSSDSLVFVFTGNNLVNVKTYSTGSTAMSDSTVYTYDGNSNVTKMQLYSISAGTATLDDESSFTYDTKNSPFNFGYIALLFDSPFWVGKNNNVLLTTTGNPPFTNTYTFNSKSYPVTQTVSVSGFPVGGATYFYQ
jgi:hypothetical protein